MPMKRLVVALAVWLACAGAASAQHEDERYVPETDPRVLAKLTGGRTSSSAC